MRQAPNRNLAVRGEYGSPRQQAPRQPGNRQPGYRQPSPRRETTRTAEAGEGGSRLLIGVIVALVAACLPIFVFLGYKLLSRAPAVAKAPADAAASSDTATSSADSSAAGAPVRAGLPPKLEQAPSVQPANLTSSTAAPSSSFTPPTVASPSPSTSSSPSVSSSQPPPSAFQPTPNPVQPTTPPATGVPAAGAPTTPAPFNPTPVAGATSPGNSSGGSSFGSGAAAAGGNPASSAGPRPGVLGSTREVVQVVEPAVVVVEVPNVGLGSGFVIDSSRGIIATNYHVIEGAKTATVTFLTDKAKFDVTGFLQVERGKDLAILKIEPRDRVLKALPLAETPPDKGESVLAFGAPKGFGGSVSDGIVSSVRNGSELSEMLGQGGRANIYKDLLGYDLDAVWIQTTAPISGGNSGGPLVNMRGEVVGLNTWNRTDGQNLNFAISAEHVRKIMQSVQSGPRALAELPPPRKQHGGGDAGAPGDPQKTLAYWEQVGKINRSMYKRVKKIARPALPVGGKNPKGFAIKMAAYYRKLAEILPDHAARLKDIDVKDVDIELVALVTADAMIMESVAEKLRTSAISAEASGRVPLLDTEQIAKKSYSSGGGSIGQAFDVMRINFNLKYGLNFPSISGDASPSKSAIVDDDDEDDEDKSKSKAKADDKKDDPEKASARSLSLAKQMLKSPITRDAGIEKLQKIIADYPNTAAAEEAKKLLKQFAAVKKSHRGG